MNENGLRLVPKWHQKIERFENDGNEVEQEDWTDKELFQMNALNVEKEYVENKPSQVQDWNELDPRSYYRPMVARLQESMQELNQMIHMIEMIKQKKHVKEAHCTREDVTLKPRDLVIMYETKGKQMNRAAEMLRNGATSLKVALDKEARYIASLEKLLGMWKIVAPNHGTVAKPIRADEQLAVDCSYTSAGSTFMPVKATLNSLAYANIHCTTMGDVYVNYPEKHRPLTLQVSIENVDTNVKGVWKLPGYVHSKWDKDQVVNLTDSAELEEYNTTLLRSVQHSVYCEELFQRMMSEALQPENIWIHSARSMNSKGITEPLSIMHVMEDEMKVPINAQFVMTIELVKVKPDDQLKSMNGVLEMASWFMLQYMQEAVQNVHAAKAGKRFDGKPTVQYHEILQPCITKVAHYLLKKQVMDVLDRYSAMLAKGNTQLSVDNKMFPGKQLWHTICDTERGIYLHADWKVSKKLAFSECELIIGKYYANTISIDGNKIVFAPESIAKWGAIAPGCDICLSLLDFETKLITILKAQIAEMIYRHLCSISFPNVYISPDHLRVTVNLIPDWDGSTIGEKKMSTKVKPDFIEFRPVFLPDKHRIEASCILFAAIKDYPQLEIVLDSNQEVEHTTIDWQKIPGNDDHCKLLWLSKTISNGTDHDS